MRETTRTLIFVVVAGISVALATVTHFATKPEPLQEFEAVGKEFYPDFKDPNDAKALKVVTYDEDTAKIKEFSVKFKDGRWRIDPWGYPADAKDRLYETAASVIGIKRGAMAGRRASSHEKFGVIEPPESSEAPVTTLKGIGQRVTLYGADGQTVLADYIVGKKVEDEEKAYYVRKPGESEVYITQLDISLSAKFTDWIESDLLKLSSWDLVDIVVDKYSVDEVQGTIVGQETSHLSREKSGDDWKLDDLNEETEEVNKDNVRDMVNDLDDLKIVGVRPKPRGIRGDLTIDEKFVKSQSQLNALILELQTKGYFIDSSNKEKPRLVADEGELTAATNEGVVYTLRFGKIFTGTEFEIETGFASDKSDKDKAKKKDISKGSDKAAEKSEGTDDTGAEKKEADEKAGDDEKSAGDSEEGEKKEDLKKSRYVFVSTRFDRKYIPDEPEKPVEPKKPAGPPKPESTKKDDTEKKKESGADEEPPKGDDGGEEPKPDGDEKSDAAEKTEDEKTEDAEKKDPQAEYEEAKNKYEEDLKKYEEDLKEYNKKIEDGKKKVEELNERFADWYYIISAESFENLRLARSELVKPKEKKEEEKSDDEKNTEEKKSDDEKPAPEKKSDAEMKQDPEKKAAPEKKADTEKKPAAEKKPETKGKPAPKEKADTGEKRAPTEKPAAKKQPVDEKGTESPKPEDGKQPKAEKKAKPSD